jgi:hypothetical protein
MSAVTDLVVFRAAEALLGGRIEACAVSLAQDQRMTQQLHGCIADLLFVAVRRFELLLDEART